MKWQLRYGKDKETFARVKKQTGIIRKEVIEPKIPPRCFDFLKAYQDLAGRRKHSMGSPQPLQTSEMESYARIYGFEQETELLIFYVSGLDSEFFIYHAEKAETDRKSVV